MSESAYDYQAVVLEHYRKEAESQGTNSSSTMKDAITRGREIEGLRRLLAHLRASGSPVQRVIDIGCGNGYLLEVLRRDHPDLSLFGLEYTPEMVELARSRGVAGCTIHHGDVRAPPFEAGSFDVVMTERCIINVMDRDHQAKALREVARIVRSGGHFLCIEAFTDGLAQLNEARAELGLEPNAQPHHNLWFDKHWFLDTIARDFEVVDLAAAGSGLPAPNFLSSHYFVSRALYPAVTNREVIYNSHLVRFFSFLPAMGNYAPIQLYVLRRR